MNDLLTWGPGRSVRGHCFGRARFGRGFAARSRRPRFPIQRRSGQQTWLDEGLRRTHRTGSGLTLAGKCLLTGRTPTKHRWALLAGLGRGGNSCGLAADCGRLRTDRMLGWLMQVDCHDCRPPTRLCRRCAPTHRASPSTTSGRCARHYFGTPRHGAFPHCLQVAVARDPRVNIQNDKGKAKAYQLRQVLNAIDKMEAI